MAQETAGDKIICIVGPRRLQNELMASFMEQETGIPCEGYNDLCDIPAGDNKETLSQRLILWDCLGKNQRTLLADLESYGEKMFSQDPFIFFNVTQGLGIEETTMSWGIKGVFYENDPKEHYPKGVQAVFEGELWFSREIMTRHIQSNKRRYHISEKDVASLSRREVEVLARMAIGHTNEEIADNLCISHNTVKTHVYNIFKKIDVPNRLQAALWAAKNL